MKVFDIFLCEHFFKPMFIFAALLASLLNGSYILDEFESKGYCEMFNEKQGQECFNRGYCLFDELINFVEKSPEWESKLYEIDEIFAKTYENSLYGDPPIGYIDTTKSKKDKKIFFHFSEEYYQFILNDYPELVAESKEFEKLLLFLREITQSSEEKLEEALHQVGLLDKMKTEDGKFLILTKIVRYAPSDFNASSPHFDFSGFSFLIDNSDSNECESLLIAPPKENLTADDFYPPKRKIMKTSSTSSLLLIPGLALQALDLPIKPTAHAVKQQANTRYAIIVFAMAPNVKLSYSDIKAPVIDFKP